MMESASMQLADVILVSTDGRGYRLARSLALRGWKTVLLELHGGLVNRDLDLEDRIGPFVSYSESAMECGTGTGIGSLWFRSGPAALTGSLKTIGNAHLAIRYGIDRIWIKALGRSLLATRLKRREAFLDSASPTEREIDWDRSIKPNLNVSEIVEFNRKNALAAGVRILEVEKILNLRIQDNRLDRIELRLSSGETLHERTRSAVWLLSLDETRSAEFIEASDAVGTLISQPKMLEPLMAWWRSRISISGLRSAKSAPSLQQTPELPAHLIYVGSLERPWTHFNIMALDQIEKSKDHLLYDIWMRLPYWSRADHVYRDEQRTRARKQLAERLPGCELDWVTPSPIGLSDASVRMPHILYSHDSDVPVSMVQNLCYAGPEVWRGIGLIGLELCEKQWMADMERLRMDWDPAARVNASRLQKFKFKIQGLVNSDRSKESELSP